MLILECIVALRADALPKGLCQNEYQLTFSETYTSPSMPAENCSAGVQNIPVTGLGNCTLVTTCQPVPLLDGTMGAVAVTNWTCYKETLVCQ